MCCFVQLGNEVCAADAEQNGQLKSTSVTPVIALVTIDDHSKSRVDSVAESGLAQTPPLTHAELESSIGVLNCLMIPVLLSLVLIHDMFVNKIPKFGPS